MYSKFLVLKTKCVAESHRIEEVGSRASLSMVTWNSRTLSFSGKQTSLLFSSPLIFLHCFQVFTNWYKVNMKKVLDVIFFFHLLQGGYRYLKMVHCLQKLFC